MCGITGFWSHNTTHSGKATLQQMTDAIQHRGPDDEGSWADAEQKVFLGQRRLSIIDLSSAGHQPMLSPCARYSMVFNGEIYNHLSLRKELALDGAAPAWKGHSDSETLVTAISHWGFDAAIAKLNGMFAIVVWDAQQRVMRLARDRMGEKPLYYGSINGVFMFASELNALRAHPVWTGDINRHALSEYLSHFSVPAPLSIHTNIHKLPPAHSVTIASPIDVNPQITEYWCLSHIALEGTASPSTKPLHLLQGELREILTASVEKRMLSDVPLGAFLSGGYDSSLVVSIMQQLRSTPVDTFTIGFHEEKFDEAPHAKAVAAHLGTNHTELYLDAAQTLDVVGDLSAIWDEPFADSSQIPTYLLAKLTRSSVKVSLSGDGGDELFYGYSRYQQSVELWSTLKRYPVWFRKLMSKVASTVGLPLASFVLRITGGRAKGLYRLFTRAAQFADVIGGRTDGEMYYQMIKIIKFPSQLGGPYEPSRLQDYTLSDNSLLENKMMYADMRHYLPDTVLTKVDRATMAAGLESRAPLLDHELVEFAWQLPMSAKFQSGVGKWLLRQVLYENVPQALLDRPKMGFGVPIGAWLRGPLKDWGEALIDEKLLREQGFFNVKMVRHMWASHQSGVVDLQHQLWAVLMFQAWYARYY